ncbi:MAG: SGNH/GDSL hydrolase family protein [Sulfurospirillum sp.]|nr:SGNH/GDSL hydrolase family protein [Sulfurospirillum sp.]
MKTLLSLGDCNTLGIHENYKNAYPEKFANMINHKCINCGFTMSTCKEGLNFFNDTFNDQTQVLTIQYGLVDSWNTFKYSPYILYYPDNFLRKILRKIIKKYKKICRKWYLHKFFGEKNVISKNEYYNNISSILMQCKNQRIILIDTVPNLDTTRNNNIKIYNKILDDIALKYPNCRRLYLYDYFLNNTKKLYLADGTHINNLGHNYIAEQLKELYENWDY